MTLLEFYHLEVDKSYVEDSLYRWKGVVCKREFGFANELRLTIDCGLDGYRYVSGDNLKHVERLKKISPDSYERDLLSYR